MALVVRKATRSKAKARIMLHGPSGAGKTYSALLLAFGLGKRVVIIDTENGSADSYAALGQYDVTNVKPPYDTDTLVNGIKQLEADYDVIIIDSLSAWWIGEGGLLDLQERLTEASPGKNSYASYRKITPRYQRVIDTIIGSSAHIIVCARAKQDYQQVEEGGKKKIVKLGLSPQLRPDTDYEFGLVFALSHDSHIATTDKDRMGLFPNDNPHKITRDTGIKILEWVNGGVDAPTNTPEEAPKLTPETPTLPSGTHKAKNPEIDPQNPSPAKPFDPSTGTPAATKEPRINWGKLHVTRKSVSAAIGREVTEEDVRNYARKYFQKESGKTWTLDEFDNVMKWLKYMMAERRWIE